MSEMGSDASVHLLEIDADLGRFLDELETSAASRVAIPVLTVGEDGSSDLTSELEQIGAFGGIVIDGVVLHQLVVGEQLGMRLVGPGDLILTGGGPPPMLVGESRWRAIAGTRVALLGREFLLAARRWPGLFAGLQFCCARQGERLATQLVICQLPRVDQRVLALMWLLAESWGRVTPSGTTLPLSLTHDAIGALVGARRPTVTLALRDLNERGALLRQDHGWLLIEPPPQARDQLEAVRVPAPIDADPRAWRATPPEEPEREDEARASFYASVHEAVAHLRERHERNRARFREEMARMKRTRARCQSVREAVTRDRLRRRRSPSS